MAGNYYTDRSLSFNKIGNVVVIWLCLTWISTIILGVPISTALFGDPAKGLFYGLLAAISSFIFQLPLQLFFLECHVLERDKTKVQIEENDVENTILSVEEDSNKTNTPLEIEDTVNPEGAELSKSIAYHVTKTSKAYRTIWKQIFFNLLKNPVEWGILFGFFFSLTTIGPRFLNPRSSEFVPSLQWVNDSLAWLGNCVTPVSLVAMGVWMHTKGSSKLFGIKPLKMSFYMLAKCFVVPLLMVGLAQLMQLNNEASRAAGKIHIIIELID